MSGMTQKLGALFAGVMAVAPAWADYTSTVFNRPYTYVFRGTENANWATVGNWYTYTTSDNGTNWTQLSGAVPGVPNSERWDAVLLDGALMGTISAGGDGYKTITMAGTLEGWETPIGVANGVHLKISTLKKLQGGGERSWRVDENSKITVTTFGVSNNTSAEGQKFYVDAPEGITFQNPFTGGSKTPGASCYFGKRGSIKFEQGTGGGDYTIASVALDCGGGFTQKCVRSRTLIAYVSTDARMTVSNASVTGSYQDGTEVACFSKSSTPTTDDPVGTYKLTVGDTGVVITYVATEALEEGSLPMGYSRAAPEPVQNNSKVALALSTAELASGQVTFTSPNATEPSGVTWLLYHAGTAIEGTPTAIDGQSGTWTLTFTPPDGYEAITLDVRGPGIPAAAKTVQPAAATNGVAFGKSSDYLAISADGTEWQGAKVTGASGSPMIFGGLGYADNGPINRDILLTVTGGDFSHIYGGNNANYWDSQGTNRTRIINGNTRVEMSGGTVNYLLGGNYNDGNVKPVTLGNIDVVVSGTAEVKGSIFGGSVTAHNRGTTVGSESQSQNVTVKIKNLQEEPSAASVQALQPGYIAGGDTYMSNASPTSNIYGDTAVVIDLPAETTGTFDKRLVGGSALLEGGDQRSYPQLKVNGNSSVTIDAPNTVTFSQTVMGGPAFAGSGGSAVTTGNASVTIRGGKYTGTIYAGGSGASASVTGNATLTLESGDFSAATIAPCGNGSSVGGISTLAIAGDVDLSTTTLSDFSTFSVAEGKTLTLGTKRLTRTTLTAGANAGWDTLAVTLTEAEVTAGYAELCGYSGKTLPRVRVTLPDAAWSTKVIGGKLVLSTGVKKLTWPKGAANWSNGLTGFNPGDYVTFDTTTGSEAEGVAVPSGIAAGEMTVNGAYTFTLEDFGAGFSASKITVSSSGKATFESKAVRYVRLQLDNANGGTDNNAVPGVSELILTKGGEVVSWPSKTTIKQVNTDGSTTDPIWGADGNEKVNALIDGVWNGQATYTNPATGATGTYKGSSGNNKWWPYSNPKAYAVISLGDAVDFDGYKLMTTDHSPRSAKNWTLEVSADGETWFVADSRTNRPVPDNNSFYVYEGGTIFPVDNTVVSAPIAVESSGTLGGSATFTGPVTFANGAVLDVTAGAPTVTGEVTASGTVTVVLPEGTVLQPVLKTATTGLASRFLTPGYEFLYREGTYWAVQTAAKTLTAEVTVTSNLSNLTWTWTQDADSKVVACADLLKLWDFGMDGVTATLNTTSPATVTIDCATVPALTLSGSAALTLSAADGVSPTIASLTVGADSTVAADLLNHVTGAVSVAENKTLSLSGTGVSLTKSLTGAGNVAVLAECTVECRASLENVSGNISVAGTLTLNGATGETVMLKNAGANVNNASIDRRVSVAKNGVLKLTRGIAYAHMIGEGTVQVTGSGFTFGQSASFPNTLTCRLEVLQEAALKVVKWCSGGDGLTPSALVLNGSIVSNGSTGTSEYSTYSPLVTVKKGCTLSGGGTLDTTTVAARPTKLAFADGAVLDVTAGVPTAAQTSFGDTLLVKVASEPAAGTPELVLKGATRKPTQVALTGVANPPPALAKVGTVDEDSGLVIVVPSVPTTAADKAGLSEPVRRALQEAAVRRGMETISTVTNKPSGSTKGGTKNLTDDELNGVVELFSNILSVTPTTEDPTAYTATVSYEFGVSDITVKRVATATANLTEPLYVVVCAKVERNGDGGEGAAADYANGTTVSLWLNGATPEGVVTLTSEADFTALGLAPKVGEKWFAVPLANLKTVTNNFTVRASNTTQANTTP